MNFGPLLEEILATSLPHNKKFGGLMSGKLAGPAVLSVARAHVHPEMLLDELDNRGYCMWGRNFLLKSREALVSTRSYCIVAGSHLMVYRYVSAFTVGVWLTRPSNKNGLIMPRANKAGEDALCCMLTAH